MNCCKNCFRNEHVIAVIEKNDTIGDCDHCDAKATYIIPESEIGPYLYACIRKAYEPRRYGQAKDSCISVREIFDWQGVFSGEIYEWDLVDDLICSIGNESLDEFDEPLFKPSDLYRLLDEETERHFNDYSMSWGEFKDQILHYARFFDIGGESGTRERLLSSIRELLPFLEHTIPAGTMLWRSRECDIDIVDSDSRYLGNELGPPPPAFASNGRMNPRGIPYFYTAEDANTAIIESRSRFGFSNVHARFETIVPIRVVDINRSLAFRPKNIFDPEYRHEEHWVSSFLYDFHCEISRPITDAGALLDYVPTQVFSEYIRYLGYNGIRFRSSVHNGGTNCVLFCGPVEEAYFEVFYFPHISDIITPYTEMVSIREVRKSRGGLREDFDCARDFDIRIVEEPAPMAGVPSDLDLF